jgi:hypothetical protein
MTRCAPVLISTVKKYVRLQLSRGGDTLTRPRTAIRGQRPLSQWGRGAIEYVNLRYEVLGLPAELREHPGKLAQDHRVHLGAECLRSVADDALAQERALLRYPCGGAVQISTARNTRSGQAISWAFLRPAVLPNDDAGAR